MSDVFKLGLSILFAATIAWTIGCSSKQPDQPTAQPATGEQMDHGAAHDDAMADDAEMRAKIEANLASLSVEDRELALKQKVCPISGDALGMMSAPLKLDVEGHTVFICCESCEEPLLSDPDRYLAKLGLVTDAPADIQ